MARQGRGPTEVLVVEPGSLPRTPSGKIQRHLVRSLRETGALQVDAQVVFRAARPEGTSPQAEKTEA